MDMSHPFQVSKYRIATCSVYRANPISPLQDASQNVMEPCKKCNLLPSTASCLLIQLVALSSSMKRTCCNGLRLKPRSLKKLLQSPSESLSFRSNPMRACHWQSNDVQNILKGFAKAPLAAKGIPWSEQLQRQYLQITSFANLCDHIAKAEELYRSLCWVGSNSTTWLNTQRAQP